MKCVFVCAIIIFSPFFLIRCNISTTDSEGTTEVDEYLINGEKITTETQKELLKNVSMAMKEGGPAFAIEFCNLKAARITDSLSAKYNCSIERIANKYRNENNKPDTKNEMKLLSQFEENYNSGTIPEATVVFSENSVEYYQPIFIGMETCLQCHGTRETGLMEETQINIAQLYPDDRATGFKLNDFRGAWKITFKK